MPWFDHKIFSQKKRLQQQTDDLFFKLNFLNEFTNTKWEPSNLNSSANHSQTVFAFDVTKLLAPNVERPFFWFNDFNNYFFLFWSKFLFSVIFWRNLKPKSAWLNRMISVSTLCKKIIENRPLEFWHRLLSIENG